MRIRLERITMTDTINMILEYVGITVGSLSLIVMLTALYLVNVVFNDNNNNTEGKNK